MFSLHTGHTAWTDPETGSWFISTLCQVLQETAKDTDLVQMLIEVNERVSEKVDQKNHAPVETPSTLSKKLYFNQPEPFNL